MRENFPIGSVARLYFTLVSNGEGATAKLPTIAIQRVSDGRWFDATTGLFVEGYAMANMRELDVKNLPGRYYFDFDHGRDLTVSSRFIVKMQNADPAVLSYGDLHFGVLPAVTAPRLCSIEGVLFGAEGAPLSGALVQATLIPVYSDALGRGYQGDAVLKAYTSYTGAFELPVVQGATIRLEIRAIGWDRRALVPEQPSVLFTQL